MKYSIKGREMIHSQGTRHYLSKQLFEFPSHP
jgi:hypothetical protein